ATVDGMVGTVKVPWHNGQRMSWPAYCSGTVSFFWQFGQSSSMEIGPVWQLTRATRNSYGDYPSVSAPSDDLTREESCRISESLALPPVCADCAVCAFTICGGFGTHTEGNPLDQ